VIRLTITLLILTLGLSATARAADEARIIHAHGIAMHGTPKYAEGFPHFDYVNPDAPKGGSVRLATSGTYDSFNPFIPKGNFGVGSGMAIESLMVSSTDEAFTQYGLIAESITYPEDRSWITFHLRPEARWHDGQPITPADVVFSFNLLKEKGRPFYRFYYASVTSAEITGERDVTFRFAAGENLELPLIIGQLSILPKHYWEGRDFSKTTLEPPLGSGPYRIANFEAGRYVEVERVADYWGQDLPVKRGHDNFDRMRYDYYRDPTVIREAIKAGDIDYYLESQAKAWAQDFDIEAVQKGWLVKEEVAHDRPAGMQAFVMNLRRQQFQDVRVREALAYAFDFEWTNKNLFFGQYTRAKSFFSNSELGSSGLPTGDELAILEPYRGQLPQEVFTKEYQPPVTNGSGQQRTGIRTALRLFKKAGYEVRDQVMINAATGQPLQFEMLLRAGGSGFRRIVLPMQQTLKRMGIVMSIREVDDAQYINRLRDHDYDMISSGWGQGDSPGNEQRGFWGSAAADQAGSRNLAGLKDPVVDALIEQLIAAPDREQLVLRTRALDRVLLAHHFIIPNWYLSKDRILYWNKFARPSLIKNEGTRFSWWWYDEAKAQALNAATGKSSN
jgi:microcin C transport system substrate-binding protein